MATVVEEKPAVQAAVEPEQQPEKLVIVSCSGELEKVWATLILATTGAAMGKDTMVFFTFWGFPTLVREDVRVTGDNWMQKMMSVVHRGGASHLKLGTMNFGGVGTAMMKHLAKAQNTASPAELLTLAKDLGVRLVPCQMSMDLMGLKREDLIDGVDDPIGATTMLAEAQGAITLFI